MNALGKCAGFDPSEFEMGYRNSVGLAISASKHSAAKLRRWKEAARFAPPTAAPPGFPYPHKTCAEWMKWKAEK